MPQKVLHQLQNQQVIYNSTSFTYYRSPQSAFSSPYGSEAVSHASRITAIFRPLSRNSALPLPSPPRQALRISQFERKPLSLAFVLYIVILSLSCREHTAGHNNITWDSISLTLTPLTLQRGHHTCSYNDFPTAQHHSQRFAGLSVRYMWLEFEPIPWLWEGGHGWMRTQDTDDKLHSPVCHCLYQHMLSLVLQYHSNVILNFHP